MDRVTGDGVTRATAHLLSHLLAVRPARARPGPGRQPGRMLDLVAALELRRVGSRDGFSPRGALPAGPAARRSAAVRHGVRLLLAQAGEGVTSVDLLALDRAPLPPAAHRAAPRADARTCDDEPGREPDEQPDLEIRCSRYSAGGGAAHKDFGSLPGTSCGMSRRLMAPAPGGSGRATRRRQRPATRGRARHAPHAAAQSALWRRAARAGAGASASPSSGRWWCWPISAARWIATRGCCCCFVYGLARGPATIGRSVCVRHAPDADHPAAARPRHRRRDRRGRARGHRLVGRHAHRRGAERLQLRLGSARAGARRGGAADQRRLGSRRSRAAAQRDGAPAAQLPPPDLAQPAARLARLPAADARHAGRAAVCR